MVSGQQGESGCYRTQRVLNAESDHKFRHNLPGHGEPQPGTPSDQEDWLCLFCLTMIDGKHHSIVGHLTTNVSDVLDTLRCYQEELGITRTVLHSLMQLCWPARRGRQNPGPPQTAQRI